MGICLERDWNIIPNLGHHLIKRLLIDLNYLQMKPSRLLKSLHDKKQVIFEEIKDTAKIYLH